MANIGGGSLQQARPNKSAALAKLEKEIKELRGENARLKSEVSSIKCLYDQLVHETPHEQFSEKRVQLLKSQLHLLERQMEVQNQALQSRAQVLTDMVALLDYILDDSCSKEMEGRGEKTRQEGKLTTQEKMDSLQEKARTMKARIFHSNQAYTSATATRLSFPHLPSSLLASPIDVCTCGHGLDKFSSESTPASQLNLQYVTSLESELAQLYGNLTQIQSCFQSHPLLLPPSPSSAPLLASLSSLLGPLTDHQQHLVKVTSDLLANCCSHILSLSLLAPSSPPLPSTEDSTASASGVIDSLFTRLKPHVRNRKEVKEIVQEVAKSFDHDKLLQKHKSSALENELEFHRSVYQLQVNYVSSLFEAVRKGYETFEGSVQDVVCTPLDAILLAYSDFSKSREEDKLRIFLAQFQEREESLRNVVDSLRANYQDKSGDILGPKGREALSAFGEHFFENLQKLEKECHDKKQSYCDK